MCSIRLNVAKAKTTSSYVGYVSSLGKEADEKALLVDQDLVLSRGYSRYLQYIVARTRN